MARVCTSESSWLADSFSVKLYNFVLSSLICSEVFSITSFATSGPGLSSFFMCKKFMLKLKISFVSSMIELKATCLFEESDFTSSENCSKVLFVIVTKSVSLVASIAGFCFNYSLTKLPVTINCQ